MATLTVWKFPTAGARRAEQTLKELQQELIKIHDAAIVTYPEGAEEAEDRAAAQPDGRRRPRRGLLGPALRPDLLRPAARHGHRCRHRCADRQHDRRGHRRRLHPPHARRDPAGHVGAVPDVLRRRHGQGPGGLRGPVDGAGRDATSATTRRTSCARCSPSPTSRRAPRCPVRAPRNPPRARSPRPDRTSPGPGRSPRPGPAGASAARAPGGGAAAGADRGHPPGTSPRGRPLPTVAPDQERRTHDDGLDDGARRRTRPATRRRSPSGRRRPSSRPRGSRRTFRRRPPRSPPAPAVPVPAPLHLERDPRRAAASATPRSARPCCPVGGCCRRSSPGSPRPSGAASASSSPGWCGRCQGDAGRVPRCGAVRGRCSPSWECWADWSSCGSATAGSRRRTSSWGSSRPLPTTPPGSCRSPS